MEINLFDLECRSGKLPLLKETEVKELMAKVSGWVLVEGKLIEKSYTLPNFKSALTLVNLVSEIAEKQNHHPEIWFTWGKVKLTFTTHSAGGLTENDFIIASKIDKLVTE